MKNGENKKVLVIGAGIAGMTAALELSEAGHEVALVERGRYIGGNAVEYCCKADSRCNQCAACLVRQTIGEVSLRKGISVYTRSELEDVRAENGCFSVIIHQKESHVNPALCILCGICEDKCPVNGKGKAITRPPVPIASFSYVLDTQRCLYFRDKSCTECRNVCPVDAIDFEAGPVKIEMKAASIILASGFQPFDARLKPQYGYGRFRNVVSGRDLEGDLRMHDRVIRPSDGQEPNRIAFIQCVGSRDIRLEHEYCSQVCCGYALKTAKALRFKKPGTEVTLFYIDLQACGKGWEPFIQECRRELRLVRGLPGEIEEDGDGNLRIDYEDLETNELIHGVFDLVVLSVGMVPAEGADRLSHLLAIETDEKGFFKSRSAFENTLTKTEGIFLAGACENPRNIPDSILHAKQAAFQTLAYLDSK